MGEAEIIQMHDMPEETVGAKLYSVEAEMALLGILMLENSVVQDAESAGLLPTMFALVEHQLIYDAIVRQVSKGKDVNTITLAPYFEARGTLDDIGGAKYLVRCCAYVPNFKNSDEYISLIIDFYRKRVLHDMLTHSLREISEGDIDVTVEDLIVNVERDLGVVHDGGGHDEAPSIAHGVDRALAFIDDAYRHKGTLRGVPTGLTRIDAMLSGLQRSKLYILAGRPAMGKTALATCFAETAAAHGKRVAFYSMEMDCEELNGRRLSMRSKIPFTKMRDGHVSQDEIANLSNIAADLKNEPFEIDDRPRVTVAQIKSRARRIKRKRGLDLIVVDYLQLIEPETRYKGSRVNEIGEISRALKIMARELDVAVLCLSQLSRDLEKRDNKKPMMSDLRDSGSIEQDADCILFVYREIVYKERDEPPEHETDKHLKWQNECLRLQEHAEIIVSKQRGGAIGSANVKFIGEQTRFVDWNSYDD